MNCEGKAVSSSSYRFLEGVPLKVEREDLQAFEEYLESATGSLRPTLKLADVNWKASEVTFRNLVGQGTLHSGATFEVVPKTSPGSNWATNAANLFEKTTRFHVTHSASAVDRSDLENQFADAIAFVFLKELKNALAKSGPIAIQNLEDKRVQKLRGKLKVNEWSLDYLLKPNSFPVELTRLTTENFYSRTLITASRVLCTTINSPQLRLQLEAVARKLSSDGDRLNKPIRYVPPRVKLPNQWRFYESAWNIAKAIINQDREMGIEGKSHGLAISVEPWRLLENALKQTLEGHFRTDSEVEMSFQRRSSLALIDSTAVRWVKPDGIIERDGQSPITFECKYHVLADGVPPREHIYQAWSSALALDASHAILVYPSDFGLKELILAGSKSDVRLYYGGLGIFESDFDSRAKNFIAQLSAVV